MYPKDETMKKSPGPKYKPVPSKYQLSQRNNAIILILLFTVLAMAIGAAIYFYQRHSLIP